MNLQIGKMSRRKQAKPNRLNEDEEQDEPGALNGELYHFYSMLPIFPDIATFIGIFFIN